MANIVLRNATCTAEVQLRGAQLASFKGSDGREVIWQADPNVWAQHTPVLFPVCGTAKNNEVIIDGVSYPMPKHGFTRNPEFEVVKQGDDFVDLALRANDETRTMFPFNFTFHVIYTLVENGCACTFLVENNDDRTMPFCVGGHPGFALPMVDGANFTDHQLVFPQAEDGKNSLAPGGGLIDGSEYLDCFHNSDTLPLSYDLFDPRDALIFTELKSRSVKLVHKATGKGIEFSFPKLEVLAVWTKPGAKAPYLCLEPWHGAPASVNESGKFEDKPFVTLLESGKCWQGGFSFTVI